MKRILEEFYEGNLNPSEAAFTPDGAYAQTLREVAEAEEAVRKCLEPESREAAAFATYRQAQETLTGITAKEQFLRGFRLGVRLGIEVADGCEPEWRDIP